MDDTSNNTENDPLAMSEHGPSDSNDNLPAEVNKEHANAEDAHGADDDDPQSLSESEQEDDDPNPNESQDSIDIQNSNEALDHSEAARDDDQEQDREQQQPEGHASASREIEPDDTNVTAILKVPGEQDNEASQDELLEPDSEHSIPIDDPSRLVETNEPEPSEPTSHPSEKPTSPSDDSPQEPIGNAEISTSLPSDEHIDAEARAPDPLISNITNGGPSESEFTMSQNDPGDDAIVAQSNDVVPETSDQSKDSSNAENQEEMKAAETSSDLQLGSFQASLPDAVQVPQETAPPESELAEKQDTIHEGAAQPATSLRDLDPTPLPADEHASLATEPSASLDGASAESNVPDNTILSSQEGATPSSIHDASLDTQAKDAEPLGSPPQLTEPRDHDDDEEPEQITEADAADAALAEDDHESSRMQSQTHLQSNPALTTSHDLLSSSTDLLRGSSSTNMDSAAASVTHSATELASGSSYLPNSRILSSADEMASRDDREDTLSSTTISPHQSHRGSQQVMSDSTLDLLKTLETRLQVLTAENASLDTRITEMNAECLLHHDTIATLTFTNAELTAVLSSQANEKAVLVQEVADLTETLRFVRARLEEAEARALSNEHLRLAENKIEKLQKENEALRAQKLQLLDKALDLKMKLKSQTDAAPSNMTPRMAITGGRVPLNQRYQKLPDITKSQTSLK
ncbi:hypothetical protein DFJ77DRAFT_505663 [Powellomyces hirtus]|nr:hypothetical protein DFJ77DRAFT_505663 [Powellomyces hirtus]